MINGKYFKSQKGKNLKLPAFGALALIYQLKFKHMKKTHFPQALNFKGKTFISFFLLIAFAFLLGCEKEFKTENSNEKEISTASLNQKVASVENSFKVMSFNIRHDDDDDPQSLDERKEIILQVILDNDPDIVGIQEFSNNWFEYWLVNEMDTEGYDAFTPDTSNESSEYGTPKAIFYKRDRFSLIDGDSFKMVYSEKRCGRWAILEDNNTNNQYFICNSHWTTVSSDERVENANDVIDVIQENYANLPVIVFGDFNAEPETTEISTIKDALGDNSLVCTHSESGETYHKWTETGTKKIDWIFCSRNLAFIESSVVETSYDDYWPSDHWPITATFIPAILGSTNFDIAGISASSKTSYYFADVDGDGDADKIYWNPTFDDGHTRVYFSDGDGTFTFAYSDSAGASQDSSTSYYFADVNGDGKADKICWDPTKNSGRTRVYLSDGDGTFTFANSNTNGTSESTSTTFYFADVDGDGNADKIYWNPTFDDGHTRVYLSNGDGTFTFTDSNTNGSSESTSTTFYFADVNGDDKADKIYWNPTYDDGHTRVYLSNGDGTFTFTNSNTNGTSESTYTTFYFADVNSDGKADKIYWNPNVYKGKIKFYLSNGDGTFDDPIYSLRGTSQSTDTKFYFADIDGNGKCDEIRWNYTESPGDYSQGTLKNYLAY